MNFDKLRNIYLTIRDVNNLSQKNFAQLLENKGITPVQFGILNNLSCDEKVTMTKLYKLVGCVPSNMTTLIKRMVRDGLVETAKNPQDQRETLVFLTKKGETLRESLFDLYDSFLKQNYAGLTCEEQVTLSALLNKLEKSLTKE
ncbi:MarR family winged helix-turn-helix transcriptional regulator [Bacillus songklensis]|uniref:MarR family winged helix-turn-helix transcriptional regulator n=1 Tax=Bacillus songklensis TaxID=1069116 RepID=A0ABV8B7Z8_9BACI